MRFIIFIFLLLCSTMLHAQNYFQQEVNYTIHVALNDERHELRGNIIIEYTNNSNDTLKEIYFHLWPNAYSGRNTAYAKQEIENGDTRFYFSKKSQHGFIDSLNFSVDESKVKWEITNSDPDISVLTLNFPLLPGKKITIATPFRVKIPASFSRLGHFKQAYQITQWHPKPAVYNSNGWNTMPYLDMGEFFSEFGSYDVYITVPKNYKVAATGNLQNADEIKYLNSIAELTHNMNKNFAKNSDFPASDKEVKTLHYSEKNIHDFAWFADKRFLVKKGEVKLKRSGRTVTSWAFFTPENATLWEKSTTYINDAVSLYSEWIGDYQYNNCIAVDGELSAGGGMEYPGITVIGQMPDTLSLEEVIMHEVGHNWFYGILGFNERAQPWLDEGINSFYEQRYMETKYPKLTLSEKIISGAKAKRIFGFNNYRFRNINYLAYLYSARQKSDQPSTTHSKDLSMVNYGTIIYMKTAEMFNYLKEYLGADSFDKGMQSFFEKWKFAHPEAKHLEQELTNASGKDLSWFFKNLATTTGTIDYKISNLKKGVDPLSFTGDCWDIEVENKGDINSPFTISAIKNDSIVGTKWFDGFEGKKILKVHFIDFDKLIIDKEMIIPEIDKRNNTVRRGIFQKTQGINIRLLPALEDPFKKDLFITPVAGWNNYNKTMFGILLYNNVFPVRNIDWQLLPMYSIVKNDFAGTAKISYTFYPENGPFHNINIAGSAKQFALSHDEKFNFQRYKAEAIFTMRKSHERSSAESKFVASAVSATDIIDKYYNQKDALSFFEDFSYQYSEKRTINPYNFKAGFQVGKQFIKASLEGNIWLHYNSIKKSFNARFFAGKFIYNNSKNYLYNLKLSGRTGVDDYTYNTTFLGRTQSLYDERSDVWSRQFIKSEGGFAQYTMLGQSNNWLTSLNLSTSLPSEIPWRFYFNIATYHDIKKYDKSGLFIYETGIELSLIPDIFAVYFPLFTSEDMKETSKTYAENYLQKIRFTLYLEKLNLFDMRKQVPDFLY